jgi:hypothetical protein
VARLKIGRFHIKPQISKGMLRTRSVGTWNPYSSVMTVGMVLFIWVVLHLHSRIPQSIMT